jgi:hypothetical protein
MVLTVSPWQNKNKRSQPLQEDRSSMETGTGEETKQEKATTSERQNLDLA